MASSELTLDASDLERFAEAMRKNADKIEADIPQLLSEWETADLGRKTSGVSVSGGEASTVLWSWSPAYRRAMFLKLYGKRPPRRRGQRSATPGSRGPRRILRPQLHNILREKVAEYVRELAVWR